MTRNEIIALARNVFKDANPDERDAFIREAFGPEYVGEEAPNGMDSLPDTCKACSNHPRNGGSGVCFCTLGTPKVTY